MKSYPVDAALFSRGAAQAALERALPDYLTRCGGSEVRRARSSRPALSPRWYRMRCHGDLHLGEVLYTGRGFVIIDFEGEQARPLAERRRKRAALLDVAGMLRSFHYAAFSAMVERQHRGGLARSASRWADAWQIWSSWAFVRGYLQTTGTAPTVPNTREELRVLLDAFLMEKAVYELNNRPEWLRVPLHGIAQILCMEAISSEG